jgi:hypothetical protein
MSGSLTRRIRLHRDVILTGRVLRLTLTRTYADMDEPAADEPRRVHSPKVLGRPPLALSSDLSSERSQTGGYGCPPEQTAGRWKPVLTWTYADLARLPRMNRDGLITRRSSVQI